MSPFPLRQYHVPAAALALLAQGATLRADVLQGVKASDRIMQAAHVASARMATEAAQECAAQREQQLWDARAQAAQELAPLMNQLRETLACLQDSAQQIAAHAAERALHKLLLEVPNAWPALSSTRLLAAELARAKATDSAAMTLRAHSSDRPHLDVLLQQHDVIRFCADDAMQPGECVLSGPQGELRADYRANVQALTQALRAPKDAASHPQEPQEPQEPRHE